MTPAALEAWVLEIADRVVAGARVEDSRIECKGQWPGADKAARRLAAHLNSAHGENVLWIIGLDERNRTARLTNHAELANWLSAVKSHFDGPQPELITDIATRHSGAGISGLLFDSTHAPYLVKIPGDERAGGASLEVPWREGTATRSARHEDLVRILVPHLRLPAIEVLSCHAEATPSIQDHAMRSWHLIAELYLTPFVEERVVIPWHLATIRFHTVDSHKGFEIPRVRVTASGPFSASLGTIHSPFVVTGGAEVIVDAPGAIAVSGSGVSAATECREGMPLIVEIKMRVAGTADVLNVSFQMPMTRWEPDSRILWRYDLKPVKELPGTGGHPAYSLLDEVDL